MLEPVARVAERIFPRCVRRVPGDRDEACLADVFVAFRICRIRFAQGEFVSRQPPRVKRREISGVLVWFDQSHGCAPVRPAFDERGFARIAAVKPSLAARARLRRPPNDGGLPFSRDCVCCTMVA